jgi:uncharacterized RDD family membrane protein YckC
VKEIKNDRARAAQGRRAGFVSQAIAFALDVGWILVEYVVVLALFGLVRGLFTSESLHIPKPDTWVSIVALFVIGVATLEAAWSGTGRAPGMGLLGLRVVASSGIRLRSRASFWRAVLMVATLGLGLVTVLFSRSNRSVYDHVCGSAVVYDWRPTPTGGSGAAG